MKEWIAGRNPVFESLRAQKRQFFSLKISRGVEEKGRIAEIIGIARQKHIPLEWVERSQLNSLADNHQGIALQVSQYPYVELEDILEKATTKQEELFILILDMIQDPQNFGNLIRSAEAFGVHGILIPPSRAVGVTPATVHASSGACEHMLIVQCNLVQAIERLKKNNVWVVGMENDPDAKPILSISLDGPIALVVGSEGEGLRDLARKSCDFLVRLPMVGEVASLNAAVAGAIGLYLVFSSRPKNKNY